MCVCVCSVPPRTIDVKFIVGVTDDDDDDGDVSDMVSLCAQLKRIRRRWKMRFCLNWISTSSMRDIRTTQRIISFVLLRLLRFSFSLSAFDNFLLRCDRKLNIMSKFHVRKRRELFGFLPFFRFDIISVVSFFFYAFIRSLCDELYVINKITTYFIHHKMWASETNVKKRQFALWCDEIRSLCLINFNQMRFISHFFVRLLERSFVMHEHFQFG